jgi:hypothetical protein
VVTVEAGGGDGEEGIVVEVDSTGSGERPRSFRKGSKEDLEGMLLSSVAAAAAGVAGGVAAAGGAGADGRDGVGNGAGVTGVGASAAATVDAYLRSFYSSAFLRRTKASSSSSSAASGGTAPAGGGGERDGLEERGLGGGLSSAARESSASSLLLGGGEGRDGGKGSSLGGAPGGGMGGRHHDGNEKASALARAFEKRRLAVLASLRHRTRLSLVLFCPLVVLVMLFATLVSVSRGELPRGGNGARGGAEDLTSTLDPAAAAVLGAAASATGGAARDPAREKYTVMINTYKRHDMAKDAVRHYAK